MPSSRSRFADGEEAGFDVAGVEAGFDQEDVGAAFDQSLGLDVVAVAELLEGDVAAQGDGFGGGPHGSGDEARFGGGGEFVGGLARQLRGEDDSARGPCLRA